MTSAQTTATRSRASRPTVCSSWSGPPDAPAEALGELAVVGDTALGEVGEGAEHEIDARLEVVEQGAVADALPGR